MIEPGASYHLFLQVPLSLFSAAFAALFTDFAVRMSSFVKLQPVPLLAFQLDFASQKLRFYKVLAGAAVISKISSQALAKMPQKKEPGLCWLCLLPAC